jgi:predicted DNA-binding transcriptional regulator AlpA
MKKFVRRQYVEARYEVPTSTLYDWIHKRKFPKPVKIGTGHAARWSLADLDAYDAARAAERDKTA